MTRPGGHRSSIDILANATSDAIQALIDLNHDIAPHLRVHLQILTCHVRSAARL